MFRFLSWHFRPRPTLFHFTHIKAGSTWIDRILRELFAPRVLPRFGTERFTTPDDAEAKEKDAEISYLEMFRAMPERPGHVYPGMFLTKEEFESRPEFADAKRFVVIRDLRDCMVSHYFSMKAAHQPDKYGRISAAREKLRTLDKEAGLLFLFERDLDRLAEIQRSWIGSGEIVLRYEDLIGRDLEMFERLFLEQLGIPIPKRTIRAAVEKCRFENLFGRKLGEVDEKAHARQGLPGDWRNHFSPKISQAFRERTGGLLATAGYERDDQWISPP